jgi:predicted transcriptional regulator
MGQDPDDFFLPSNLLIEELSYGDLVHTVIPWHALTGRSLRALKEVVENLKIDCGTHVGFSIYSLSQVTFQDLLDVRNIGGGTLKSLIAEIQSALDNLKSNPQIYNHLSTLWDVPIGARIARKEIHDRFGGVREGGISPVLEKSKNIMIFSHPRANAEHGYEPDVWLDEDTFLYCGEGPSGDQQMVRYNKSVLQHAEKDKVLRVFDGTRGEVVYKGAFELDSEDPWFYKDSIGFDGNPRKVIMFRMLRINPTIFRDLESQITESPYKWTCTTHFSGGTSQTLAEIEFMATSHMGFRDNSTEMCEIQFLTPDSFLEDLDEDQIIVDNRNRQMVDLRTSGKSLGEIGEKFGLTRERVRQILLKTDAPSFQEVKALRESIRADKLQETRALAIEAASLHPTKTIDEIAEELQVSPVELRRIMTPQEINLFARPLRSSSQKWSDQDIIQTLREAATLEFPLTVKAYSKLLEDGFLKGPSAARISQRFRSWQTACDLAEVEAGTRTRPLDLSRWTDDDLYVAVIQYLKLPESTGAATDYDSWASGQDDVPSMGTLRNRLGAWNQIRNTAIEMMTRK